MSAKTSFVYELRSINLTTLPPNEQAAVLDRFTSFLESLSDPISFWVVEDEREVNALGSSYRLRYKRFFIESASQIDSLISNLRTKMVRVLSVPKLGVMYDGPRYVVDKESQFVQTYNVTKLGGTMYPGFLNELYPITHAVRIEIEPMDPVGAKDVSRKYA
ncbi:MAG: hypothetical protein HYW93_01680, partial [Thaumarchaeota archaeon]|nr:hypothetical protein [Nitrososphaerota archaeon]